LNYNYPSVCSAAGQGSYALTILSQVMGLIRGEQCPVATAHACTTWVSHATKLRATVSL